jgi:dihydrofolate synthase/folylpolyglutamate synthase
VERVLPLADKVAPRYGEPTEFELLTAMLFSWFADRGVQVALVEVGLGGRLDATNVWDGGVAAITNVDLDHMDRLGPTVEAIAREKAPIIKRGDLAVTGAVEPALGVIRRRARRMGAPLRVVEPLPVLRVHRDGIVAGGWSLGLRGRHQAANLAVAEGVLDALEEAGIATATSEQRTAGYRSVRWPGRLELLEVDGRDVLLDGAHNAAGAQALAAALDDLRPHLQPGRLTLVIASMADKDVDAVIRALFAADALQDAAVIATSLAAERALPAAALAERVRAVVAIDVTVVDDPDAALTAALADDGPVIVAGSLYLVGVARARFVDDPLLRDPE